MTWNYRVIVESDCRYIAEVYYNEQGDIVAYTNPTTVACYLEESLEAELDLMRVALTKPELPIESLPKGE